MQAKVVQVTEVNPVPNDGTPHDIVHIVLGEFKDTFKAQRGKYRFGDRVSVEIVGTRLIPVHLRK